MGPTSTAAITVACRGLVRMRQQLPLSGSRRAVDTRLLLLDARAPPNRLREDMWYLCELRGGRPPTLRWLSVAGDDGDDGGGGGLLGGHGADDAATDSAVRLVATTCVSHFEVMADAGEHSDGNEEPRASLAEFNGLQLSAEECSFYMEDQVNGFSYLCEVESEAERARWTEGVLACRPALSSRSSRTPSSADASGADTDPTAPEPVHDDGPVPSRRSQRQLVRGQTSGLDAENDPFGLLSLTKSAFSSATSDATGASGSVLESGTRLAPGVFAFNQIEIRERADHREDDDDDDDSASTKSAEDSTPHATNASAARAERTTVGMRRSSSGSGSGSGSRASLVAAAPPSKNECLRCRKRIGSLFRSAKVCSSCDNRFCREHCNQYAVISSLPVVQKKRFGAAAAAAKKLALVCVDCLVRQKLLSSLTELTTYYVQVVEVGGVSRLVRWKYFAQTPKADFAKHVRAWELGPLSLLSAMVKYRQQPFMFVVVLAQFVKNVEYCVETMDFYWPQFLQWGFVHLADAPPSVQTHYLFFLAAVCRRSVHLAVKATWECIAAHWDAMTTGAFERGHSIIAMLFFVTQVSFSEPRSVLHQLLFAQAPAHQLNELEALLAKLFEATRAVYATSVRDSPYFSWLLARSEEEIGASSSNARQQLFRSRDFLDPFPAEDNMELQQAALVARKSLDLGRLTDAKVAVSSVPALHIFSDVIQLVRFLVDLTTFLKECTPVPAERKTRLPGLLTEMLQGQHIRPESYLPLVPVVSTLHRVVNVLTDEGTVFSTKARAPTLVLFEVIDSDISDVALRECFRCNTNPHARTALRHRQAATARHSGSNDGSRHGEESDGGGSSTRSSSLFDSQLLDVLNFLDANIMETYVADLAPASNNEDTGGDYATEDPDGLQLSLAYGKGGPPPSSQQSEDAVVGVHGSPGSADSDLDRERWTTMAAQLQRPPSSSAASSSSSAQPCRFFGERFEQLKERVRCQSRFSQYPGWSVLPVIAKSFDDMRQEVFVLQGLRLCQLIFQKHNLDLWLRYYSIVCAGKDCGLLEVITDAQSLDALKKKAGPTKSFLQIFQQACGRNPITGEVEASKLEEARQNFIGSMAAYSLFSYTYKQLIEQGLVALHLEARQLLSLVCLSSKDSSFPCFTGTSRARIIRRLERRLCVGWTLADVARTASRIVDKSYDHLGTKQYDWFQQFTNGIAP
ncbi:hypothetical protein PybrP1_005982 [[Pythium] brassicae (nom. inval.)]|nr:hypothetical protein PybrP1_005982 [[Pythium] brassicae (nom. inval.)]